MGKNFIKDYLGQIAQYPLLTQAEELELGKAIKEGTPDEASAARERLINSNLKLVVYVAKNYKCNQLPLEDLIMEGNLGLVTAADKYDYTRGFKFSTCAIPWIKQAILKAITDKGKTIRLPAHIYQQLNKMRDAVDDLAIKGNLHPTDHDIAVAMNVDVEKVALLKEWRKDTLDLSMPIGDEDRNTLEDLVEDRHDETPVEYADKQLRIKKLYELIHTQKPRTQTILKMYYGAGEPGDPAEFFTPHTLEEVGAYIGLTRERVRQIKNEAEQSLHNQMKK